MDEFHGSDYWELSLSRMAVFDYFNSLAYSSSLTRICGRAEGRQVFAAVRSRSDPARDAAAMAVLDFHYRNRRDPDLKAQSFRD